MPKALVLEKLKTGLPGLDLITNGGLPKGRTTLVAGTSGSAKTLFASQFLAEGVAKYSEAGVFVTLEESADDLRRNLLSIGYDVARFEEQGKWIFVDASRRPGESNNLQIGAFDLGALVARIEHAVQKIKAMRVAVDSLGTVFHELTDDHTVRSELFRIAYNLGRLGVTTLMTCERMEEYGPISRHGVEEFVSDNVIILRNALENERRRRTVEVLKMRGTSHQKGEFPFTIMPGEGIVAIPTASIELSGRSTYVRSTSGNEELDKMCGGGFFKDSVVLVSGATGTGKSLTTTHFLKGGATSGERCVVFAFEESRDQLIRNAAGWGVDFEKLEATGLLRIVCEYPEAAGIEDHLVRIRDVMREYKPQRVAVDSLSALERVASQRSFREFVIALTSDLKQQQVTGLLTATTELSGGTSVTSENISTITDTIILLRYVEIFGQMRRGVTVLKMRGSMHDKDIREFTIDARGMHIGKAFRSVSGILSGRPVHQRMNELERVDEMFQGG